MVNVSGLMMSIALTLSLPSASAVCAWRAAQALVLQETLI